MHTRPDRTRPREYASQQMRAKLRPLRYWGPFVLAIVCLVVAYSVPPVVTYILVIVSFVLLFEVGTALFARAGGTGGLKDFKQ